jgi:hypothetical protein
MLPGRAGHLAAGPVEHRIIDRHRHRLPGRHQQRHHQPGDRHAQLIKLPGGPAKK